MHDYASVAQARVNLIQSPSNERTTLTWDPLDREQYRVLANGMAISHTWDPNGRETAIGNYNSAGAALAQFTNTYSAVDTRLTVLELDGTRATFSYDASSQIISEARGGTMAYSRSYVWDPLGNRLQQYDSGALTAGTFNAANQQTLITPPTGAPTTQSFDGNGNLIKAVTGSATTTQTWSPENKLVGLVSPALNESYLCSDDGLRKQETTASGTTLFTYDDVLVLLETTPGGVLQARNTDYPGQFGGLASQNRGGASSYYGYDALGSVRILVSTAGVVTDEYSNTAFGEPIQPGSGTPNPHVYVGLMRYRLQSDGSYLLSVRLLDPVTGRFTSVEPIGWLLRRSGDYMYGFNDPVDYIDSDGLGPINPSSPGRRPGFTPGLLPGQSEECQRTHDKMKEACRSKGVKISCKDLCRGPEDCPEIIARLERAVYCITLRVAAFRVCKYSNPWTPVWEIDKMIGVAHGCLRKFNYNECIGPIPEIPKPALHPLPALAPHLIPKGVVYPAVLPGGIPVFLPIPVESPLPLTPPVPVRVPVPVRTPVPVRVPLPADPIPIGEPIPIFDPL